MRESDDMPVGVIKTIAGLIAVVIFLVVVFSTYYTVDQGERGVVLHYGAYAGQAEPGLGFKFPFVTTIEKVSMRPFVMSYGRTTRLEAYSKDQQPATIRISVNMHVGDAKDLYVGYQTIDQARERLVDPKVYEQLKNIFGQFNAVEAIQSRAKLNAEVAAAITAAVKGPLQIDSVQIEDIEFSKGYEAAVEARMQATVRQQQADAEKARRIINADAAAYEVKAQADAKAHQIEVQGKAEAMAIQARGAALRDNPQLVSLQAVEKWNGILPTTMPPGGAVPFVNVAPR